MNADQLIDRYNDFVYLWNDMNTMLDSLGAAIGDSDGINQIENSFSVDDISGDGGMLNDDRNTMIYYKDNFGHVYRGIENEWNDINRQVSEME